MFWIRGTECMCPLDTSRWMSFQIVTSQCWDLQCTELGSCLFSGKACLCSASREDSSPSHEQDPDCSKSLGPDGRTDFPHSPTERWVLTRLGHCEFLPDKALTFKLKQ